MPWVEVYHPDIRAFYRANLVDVIDGTVIVCFEGADVVTEADPDLVRMEYDPASSMRPGWKPSPGAAVEVQFKLEGQAPSWWEGTVDKCIQNSNLSFVRFPDSECNDVFERARIRPSIGVKPQLSLQKLVIPVPAKLRKVVAANQKGLDAIVQSLSLFALNVNPEDDTKLVAFGEKEALEFLPQLVEVHFNQVSRMTTLVAQKESMEAQFASRAAARNKGVITKVSVAKNLLGLVIGTKGANLDRVRAIEGILEVEIEDSPDKAADFCSVRIIAETDIAASKARDLVDLTEDNMPVPITLVRSFRQSSFAPLNDAKTRSGVYSMRLSDDGSSIQITGPRKGVALAKKMLELQITNANAENELYEQVDNLRMNLGGGRGQRSGQRREYNTSTNVMPSSARNGEARRGQQQSKPQNEPRGRSTQNSVNDGSQRAPVKGESQQNIRGEKAASRPAPNGKNDVAPVSASQENKPQQRQADQGKGKKRQPIAVQGTDVSTESNAPSTKVVASKSDNGEGRKIKKGKNVAGQNAADKQTDDQEKAPVPRESSRKKDNTQKAGGARENSSEVGQKAREKASESSGTRQKGNDKKNAAEDQQAANDKKPASAQKAVDGKRSAKDQKAPNDNKPTNVKDQQATNDKKAKNSKETQSKKLVEKKAADKPVKEQPAAASQSTTGTAESTGSALPQRTSGRGRGNGVGRPVDVKSLAAKPKQANSASGQSK